MLLVFLILVTIFGSIDDSSFESELIIFSQQVVHDDGRGEGEGPQTRSEHHSGRQRRDSSREIKS
jgi:hypothetical protein